MRVALGSAILAAAFAAHAQAQTHKCVDAAGKVTYTNEPCKTLKLRDAGGVEDRITVAPAQKPAAKSAQPKPTATVEAKKPPARPQETAQQPERRCFTVRGADGKTVTRCNEDPKWCWRTRR